MMRKWVRLCLVTEKLRERGKNLEMYMSLRVCFENGVVGDFFFLLTFEGELFRKMTYY